MSLLLLLSYCKHLNQNAPPVMLPLCRPLLGTLVGGSGGVFDHTPEPPPLPTVEPKAHSEPSPSSGHPSLFLKKVLSLAKCCVVLINGRDWS